MKEQLPAKEPKSSNYSRHEEWEAKDLAIAVPLFPIFLFVLLFGDLFE